jgi:4-oxalocrotonate tautomerase
MKGEFIMPYINISIFPGHPKERKARIAEKITNVIREETNVSDELIWVTFSEIPADEWAIGGKMCAGGKEKN